jgi:hypothetical protein
LYNARDQWCKPPVLPSKDLKRILALPRRPKPDNLTGEALIELITERYAIDNPSCQCAEISPGRPCIERLRLTQAWALYEIGLRQGLLGFVNVGDGKTLLGVLSPLAMRDCKTALLLVPAKLRDQLVSEYLLIREHFRVPALVVHGIDWVARIPDVPVLHVMSYESLSMAAATTFMDRLGPDTLIADECDSIRNATAVRTRRVTRYFADRPETRFCGWSGSVTDSSIRDYYHLAAMALKLGSPLPLDPEVVEDWAKAIDPAEFLAPPGALKALMEPGETIHRAFHRRLVETPGVITSTKEEVTVSHVIEERPAPAIPAVVSEALKQLRDENIRPDGEELLDSLRYFECASQIACGFYYRWIFRNGETVPQIEEWLAARKAWRREIRDMLHRPRPHFDSPHLVAKAAARAHANPNGGKKDFWHAKTDGSDESLPHWRSQHYERWIKAKPLVNKGRNPDTEEVRLHPFIAEDAAKWASDNIGIVWYQERAFGFWVAEIGGFPLHTGGKDAGKIIDREIGDRSIVASINSHGRGRNGLQYKFHRQLVGHPPGTATAWEQLGGRLHRPGQKRGVLTWYYAHTPELAKQIDKALLRASYVQATIGAEQKLIAGILEFSPAF